MSRSTVIFVLVAVLNAALAAIPGTPEPIRAIIGIPAVLLVPGAAAAAAADLKPASPLVWACFAVGASLAVNVVDGLILDVTGIGFTRLSWAASLLVWVLVLTAAAKSPRALMPASAQLVRLRPSTGTLIASVVVLACLGGAVAVTAAGISQQRPKARFTQLWILRSQQPTRFLIGVRNEQGQFERYSLEVSPSGTGLPARLPIGLSQGATWKKSFAMPSTAQKRITANLYRNGSLYRSVWLAEY